MARTTAATAAQVATGTLEVGDKAEQQARLADGTANLAIMVGNETKLKADDAMQVAEEARAASKEHVPHPVEQFVGRMSAEVVQR